MRLFFIVPAMLLAAGANADELDSLPWVSRTAHMECQIDFQGKAVLRKKPCTVVEYDAKPNWVVVNGGSTSSPIASLIAEGPGQYMLDLKLDASDSGLTNPATNFSLKVEWKAPCFIGSNVKICLLPDKW